MLPSVLAVRDVHLKPDGLMIPRRAMLYIAGVRSDDSQMDISQSCAGELQFTEPQVALVDPARIITSTALL